MVSKPVMSVIIITRDRTGSLAFAINSILCQNYPKEKYELIVVDNGRTKETAVLVERLGRQLPNTVRYTTEPEIGIPAARNKGASIAEGEVLAFMDDDAVASKGWLATYSKLYEKYPEIKAAGGKIELRFESNVPKWLGPELLVALGYFNQGDQDRLLPFEQHPFGGNFSVRRSTFQKVGGFVQKVSSCNEEKAFFYKLYQNGYKVGYSPKALVYHRIGRSRLRKTFFLKRGFWQGIGNIRISQMFETAKIPEVPCMAKEICRNTGLILSNLLIRRREYSFSQLYYLSIGFGELCGLIFRRFL